MQQQIGVNNNDDINCKNKDNNKQKRNFNMLTTETAAMIEDNSNNNSISDTNNNCTDVKNNNTKKKLKKQKQQQQQKQQQKVQQGQVVPVVPIGWTRCHVYLQQKSRFCRQEVINGHIYCGNHAYCSTITSTTTNTTNLPSSNPTVTTKANNNNNDIDSSLKHDNDAINDTTANTNTNTKTFLKNKLRKRIVCPIDSSHTIFEDTIQTHIVKCPKAIRNKQQEEKYYYNYNINKGGYGSLQLVENQYCTYTNNNSSVVDDTTSNNYNNDDGDGTNRNMLKYAQHLALRVLEVHQQVFSNNKINTVLIRNDESTSTNTTMTNNNQSSNQGILDTTTSTISSVPSLSFVRSITRKDIENAIPIHDMSLNELQKGLENDLLYYRIKAGTQHHIHQQASIVGHLRRIGIIGKNSSTSNDCTSTGSNNNTSTNNSINSTSSQQQQQQNKTKTIIIEMGAGRGMTGLVTAGAVIPNMSSQSSNLDIIDSKSTESDINNNKCVKLIMIERDASRSRADKVFRKVFKQQQEQDQRQTFNDLSTSSTGCSTFNTISTATSTTTSTSSNYFNFQPVEWERVQCDLSHVDLTKLLDVSKNDSTHQQQQQQQQQELQKQRVVVIAKHCCGVGTDLALKSLEPIKHQLSACLMTTCCHGVCFWEDYVGREYLTSIMTTTASNYDNINNSITNQNDDFIRTVVTPLFGKKEFELLRYWSSGSVKCECNSVTTNNSTRTGTLLLSEQNKSNATTNEEEEDDDKALDDYDDHNANQKLDGNLLLSLFGDNKNNKNINNKNIISATNIVNSLHLSCTVQGLGRACQRLIDYGRLQYIKNILFNDNTTTSTASTSRYVDSTTNMDCLDTTKAITTTTTSATTDLLYYVPIDVTPQNAALIGYRKMVV